MPKKKTKKTNQDVRTHTLFRGPELELIKEARAKVEAIDKVKCTFSYFIRWAAINQAQLITGKRIAP